MRVMVVPVTEVFVRFRGALGGAVRREQMTDSFRREESYISKGKGREGGRKREKEKYRKMAGTLHYI